MSPILNEQMTPMGGFNGYPYNGPSNSETDNTLEVWIEALTRLAEQQERENRRTRDANNAPREIAGPLTKVAEGPWRSLGGYFDYSKWVDRERFLELDRAIAACQDNRDRELDC